MPRKSTKPFTKKSTHKFTKRAMNHISKNPTKQSYQKQSTRQAHQKPFCKYCLSQRFNFQNKVVHKSFNCFAISKKASDKNIFLY